MVSPGFWPCKVLTRSSPSCVLDLCSRLNSSRISGSVSDRSLCESSFPCLAGRPSTRPRCTTSYVNNPAPSVESQTKTTLHGLNDLKGPEYLHPLISGPATVSRVRFTLATFPEWSAMISVCLCSLALVGEETLLCERARVRAWADPTCCLLTLTLSLPLRRPLFFSTYRFQPFLLLPHWSWCKDVDLFCFLIHTSI